MLAKLRYSWLDLFLWLAALALLMPLAWRFIGAVARAVADLKTL
jgi:hypothetical protein